ncbi:MAG: hypothetical protein ACUVUG_00240 [Candidatus Aminicenantia bacterium]
MKRAFSLLIIPFIFLGWDGDKWGSIKRGEIIKIARGMIETPWSPNKICKGWNISLSPSEFYPGNTYLGILYTQNNPPENLEEFLREIKNLPYDYYGYWGSNNRWYNYYGNDCSAFVSICWKLPVRYSTTLFHYDANGKRQYCHPLGPVGSSAQVLLLPGDALNSSGFHIIIFNYKSSSNTIVSLEQTPNTARSRTWYYSSLQSYQPIRRNLILEDEERDKEKIREREKKIKDKRDL